jgi:hypothetical protein
MKCRWAFMTQTVVQSPAKVSSTTKVTKICDTRLWLYKWDCLNKILLQSLFWKIILQVTVQQNSRCHNSMVSNNSFKITFNKVTRNINEASIGSSFDSVSSLGLLLLATRPWNHLVYLIHRNTSIRTWQLVKLANIETDYLGKMTIWPNWRIIKLAHTETSKFTKLKPNKTGEGVNWRLRKMTH